MILAVLAVWLFVSLVGLVWLLAVYPAAKRATWTYCVILLLAFGSYFASTWALSNEITLRNRLNQHYTDSWSPEMTDITPGWAGFSRREDVQDYLVGLGDPPEAISGLLTAVEGLGSIKVYVWRKTDDLWGKHYSLYVGHSLLTKEWNVYIEAVYGY